MIRKLSATPTAMGTKKLKSESRKHSSADRQTERDTDRQQVSGFSQRETVLREGLRKFTVDRGSEERGREAREEVRLCKKWNQQRRCR